MIVAPVPVGLSIFVLQLVVVGMRAMDFDFPPRIGLPLRGPPAMIVGMHGIVITCRNGASGKDCRAQEDSGKQNSLQIVV